MEDRDRRLDLVRTRPAGRDGPVDEGAPLLDGRLVPARAVLVLEQHEVAALADAGIAPGVMEQHQRQQPGRLGLVGEQRDHDPCQADRLGAQLAADQRIARGRGVALVEHEVEDVEDAVEPLGQELGRRHAVGDPGVADLALRPDQPLREGRLRDQERPRDLGGREAAERAQRQRDPAVHRQRRMAAREDQPQLIVRDRAHRVLGHDLHRRLLPLRLEGRVARQQDLALRESPVPAQPVDRPVPRGGGDPRRGVVREAADRPRLERRDERLLDHLLGEVEVAQHADERRDRASRAFTEQAVDDLVRDLGGRQARSSSGGRSGQSATSAAARRPVPELEDRSHLDGAVSSRRDHRGVGDGLVEVGGLDEVEAAERLLGLGVRPIGRQRLPVDDADGGRGGRRVERLAGLVARRARGRAR